MNQPKRNLKIWIPIAAVVCFWLGDWMGHTYELTDGTTTHRLAAALNLNSLLLHPFRLSADAFSLGCGIATALMAGLIYLCVKYSKHRLMPQKEYGSARWGGPEDIAPFLDEDAQNNLPLTASESLSLSPKMKVTANDNYNRNKNVIVFGPSGSGKSYSVAGPQLLQFNSNYVLSDPKGELLQEYGNVLLSQGYKVKVFNLKDRDKSDHYNLFAYIKNEDDILVVTKNLVKNLKEDPTAKSTADPIWEEGMTALLEALIGYVFYELELEERNMNSVMTLLLMLESQGDGPNSVSQLDLLFDDLSINKPNSFAAKQYKLYKMAPGKTAQSINVSLGLRMSAFNIPSIANICADDTIDLRELGSEKKVALFVVTPDTTTAYNFLAAVMFQQCFQILVDIADHRPDKRLPRHLRFLLDEFPNIGMIPDFQILISTIRSRDIACTLIYQSLNQLKSQYKDDWATIYENCDSMIVLGAGGNPENLEFFSKALGKATIEVMNTSENKGSQGSYTKSYQALGRELMTPEEIRTMPRNWCLLMISGVAPFYSRKYNLKDGTYVINEEQAATVRRIFNLYAEGHGETTVAKMLIEENRKDGGGGLSWTASKVSRVLRKPTYKGYMTYNKSHIDDFLSHNRINHSEEDFVLVKGNFEPIVSEALWETCNQIRSKRAAFVKGKDGRAHKFGVSFPQNKWTKILFCDCGMRFQIEGYDKTANGGKNMRLICARSKMFKKKDAARALNGIPCPAPYASEWKLELMAREVFRTVWKENAEDILGLLRMLDANLNTTGTPNDGNQLENKLSALNEELDDLVSQRASRSITMDDFLSRSTEINNEIINVEGLLQSSIQEQRPKARLDMHSIEAALSDDASFPDGKIEPGFLDRYANRIVKSNNRYIWMLQLVNVQQIMPIQSERQPIAMVTYKSGVPYDIEQEQTGKQDKESAGPDCATICRPQDFFLNMSRTKRKRKLVEWLESCQENQVNVLDEKIPLLSFAVDFVTAYEYQKARGIKIHPGLWKDMRVDIFLVKKEN